MKRATVEEADVKPTYKVGQLVRNVTTKQEGSVYGIEHSGAWRVIVDVGERAKYVWPAKIVEEVKTEIKEAKEEIKK